MKTVKTNLKMKFFFFVTILLMSLVCIATLAVGQTTDSLKAQNYGEESLIKISFEKQGGELYMTLHTDSTLVEIVIVNTTGEERAEVVKMTKIALDYDYSLNMNGLQDMYIKTKNGITGVNYVVLIPKAFGRRERGYIMVNGKCYAKVIGKQVIESNLGDEFKDSVAWQYNPSIDN